MSASSAESVAFLVFTQSTAKGTRLFFSYPPNAVAGEEDSALVLGYPLAIVASILTGTKRLENHRDEEYTVMLEPIQFIVHTVGTQLGRVAFVLAMPESAVTCERSNLLRNVVAVYRREERVRRVLSDDGAKANVHAELTDVACAALRDIVGEVDLSLQGLYTVRTHAKATHVFRHHFTPLTTFTWSDSKVVGVEDTLRQRYPKTHPSFDAMMSVLESSSVSWVRLHDFESQFPSYAQTGHLHAALSWFIQQNVFMARDAVVRMSFGALDPVYTHPSAPDVTQIFRTLRECELVEDVFGKDNVPCNEAVASWFHRHAQQIHTRALYCASPLGTHASHLEATLRVVCEAIANEVQSLHSLRGLLENKGTSTKMLESVLIAYTDVLNIVMVPLKPVDIS
eukprot:PhM_4_TR15505/c0_g1_i1/m.48362